MKIILIVQQTAKTIMKAASYPVVKSMIPRVQSLVNVVRSVMKHMPMILHLVSHVVGDSG